MSTNKVTETVYVQLLGEGTLVYRPVPAINIGDNIYELKGEEVLDPEDEEWEFLPGARVRVEKKVLSGGEVLAAIEQIAK